MFDISDPDEKNEEKRHVEMALKRCGYPTWSFRRVTQPNPSQDKPERVGSVVLPYVKELSERLRRVFGGYGIQTHLKPQNTLRQLVVHPKDPTSPSRACGVVCHIPCQGTGGNNCVHSYVGETERMFPTRFAEHRRPSSTPNIFTQSVKTYHQP